MKIEEADIEYDEMMQRFQENVSLLEVLEDTR